jgi:hypothetical protein
VIELIVGPQSGLEMLGEIGHQESFMRLLIDLTAVSTRSNYCFGIPVG